MGYCTDYRIKCEKVEELLYELSNYTNYTFRSYTYNDEYDLRTEEAVKWYECRDDLVQISLKEKFKDIMITVTGYGEESDDIWREYIINGKYQRVEPKMIFPEFNKDYLV